MESSFHFLKGKLRYLRLREVIYLEIEGWLMWIFNGIPGFLGFCLRYLVYKLLFKQIRGLAYVQPRVIFVETNKLSVGKFFAVNSGTYINAIGNITIGDYVLIGSNVTISSGKHPIEGRMPPVFSRPSEPLPIIIENDVWIGAGAVIMPGVTLRRGSVVGANSVVPKDTEEYSVVVGVPAKKIRLREDGSSIFENMV